MAVLALQMDYERPYGLRSRFLSKASPANSDCQKLCELTARMVDKSKSPGCVWSQLLQMPANSGRIGWNALKAH